ncbi:MAG: bacillithiol biosynthesis cysteine-adding enzyme BshC [Saprospiraceae bacterium]|nr:bacillithiol biosynthesis cysteine-adding enzyme BshC [Saprospiraceae bacterium]
MNLPFNHFLMVDPSECTAFKVGDLKYWRHPEFFKEFIGNPPDLESIPNQIKLKEESYTARSEFLSIVKKQYHSLGLFDDLKHTIERLNSDKTFAIVCAHQPILFGGPLYWWYKIIHTISMANKLNSLYPEFHFIPIYYIGSEDHDFEELNHLELFQHLIHWNGKSDISMGKKSTSGLEVVLEEISSLYTRQLDVQEILLHWKNILLSTKNYGDFYFKLVHEIFKSFGLLCFNPDDASAKSQIKNIIKDEIIHSSSHRIVSDTNEKLKNISLKPQAYSREINLFYHHPAGRKRIVHHTNGFGLHDETTVWTLDEILQEIDDQPENFSPNVILRPLYQEYLIPSIAFIGGGAEINYWLQLRDLFNYHKITFPILVRRYSNIIVAKSLAGKIHKLGLSGEDFLKEVEVIINKFIFSKDHVQAEINQAQSQFKEYIRNLEVLAAKISKSELAGTMNEINKLNVAMDKIASKMLKDYKNSHEVEIQSIRKIKNQLFPNNQLQERTESGLGYYLKYKNGFISGLLDLFRLQPTGFLIVFESDHS